MLVPRSLRLCQSANAAVASEMVKALSTCSRKGCMSDISKLSAAKLELSVDAKACEKLLSIKHSRARNVVTHKQ